MSNAINSNEIPIPGFYFHLEVFTVGSTYKQGQGIGEMKCFEASGMDLSLEVEKDDHGTFLTNGINFGDFSLKKPVFSKSSELEGKLLKNIQKRQKAKTAPLYTLLLLALGADGKILREWIMKNAFPIELKINGFSSSKSDMLVEEWVFRYEMLDFNK